MEVLSRLGHYRIRLMIISGDVLQRCCGTKAAPKARFRRQFLDTLRIHVKGGSGGMGYPKFGGIGGKGGDVYLVAKEGCTLKQVAARYPQKRFTGGTGGNSKQFRILGKPGEDCRVPVPVGITVITDHGRVLSELNEAEQSVLVANGGSGGGPWNQFNGQKCAGSNVMLDLKLIADIGLVGFPNAGKSSLLTAISRATPKIASYPFTTIQPTIGMLEYDDLRQISMADLPGLIEGAHCNVGMGHKFLKHVERTKLILLVVDADGFQLSPRHVKRSCLETIILLNKELEMYKPDLLLKPVILAVNKMDTEGAKEVYNDVEAAVRDLKTTSLQFPEEMRSVTALKLDEVVPISAKNDRDSVLYLKERLRKMLDVYAEDNRVRESDIPDSTKRQLRVSAPKLM